MGRAAAVTALVGLSADVTARDKVRERARALRVRSLANGRLMHASTMRPLSMWLPGAATPPLWERCCG
jgi:hypothetical protein